MITGVPSNCVEEVWGRVEPRLQRILDKTKDMRYSTADLKEALQNKAMQLWFWNDWEVIFLTQISVWPQAKEFNIGWIEGTDIDWQEALRIFTAIAKDFDCTFISAGGRLGWMPKTKKLWQRTFCILINEIGD